MLTAGVDAENKREELGGGGREQRLEARYKNHIGELNLRECMQRVGGGKVFSRERERMLREISSNNISIKRKSRCELQSFRSLFLSIF